MNTWIKATAGNIVTERKRSALFGGLKLEYYLVLDYLKGSYRQNKTPRPRMIQLEPTRKCNLNCSMCLRNDAADGSSMKYEFFKEIMTRDFQYHHFLLLYGQGEPFLAEDIFRMIRFERDNGNYVTTVTNGTVIDNEMCRKIVQSGLNTLRISIDGASERTYTAIRKGVDFDRIVSNIESLSRHIRGARAKTKLALTFMALKDNYRDMPELVRLASQFKIGYLEIKDLPPYVDSSVKPLSVEIEEDRHLKEDLQTTVGKLRDAARKHHIKLIMTKFHCLYKKGKCRNPWFKTFITWDGKVKLCSKLFASASLAMGDLKRSTFEEIWNGSHYNSARTMLKEGEAPSEACKTYF